MVDEFGLYERIKTNLKVSVVQGSVKELGWNILEVTCQEDILKNIGFGIVYNISATFCARSRKAI